MSERKNDKATEQPSLLTGANLYALEVAGALWVIFALFVWLSLFAYGGTADPAFITGSAGRTAATLLAQVFGYASLLLPLIALFFLLLFFAVFRRAMWRYFLLHLLLFVVAMPLFSFLGADPLHWGASGGWIGGKLMNSLLIPYLGSIISILLLIVVIAIYVISTFHVLLFIPFFKGMRSLYDVLKVHVPVMLRRLFPEKEEDAVPPSPPEQEIEEEPVSGSVEDSAVASPEPGSVDDSAVASPKPAKKGKIDVRTIADQKPKKEPTKALKKLPNYELPPLDLLVEEEKSVETRDHETRIQKLAQVIEQKLVQHKIKVSVSGAVIGPVVTMYELDLGEGIRGNQVTVLETDLGRVVGGKKVRVVPSIPGKTCVGVEVPNDLRQMIRLRAILASDQFAKQKEKGLPIALGKTVDGIASVADLAKMPHLLVAGTTGSGKSVGVNTIIMSFLYTMSPAEVRFIMIDPKMNEFNIYEGIPHLLMPVVTDPKKAALTLKWAVEEMDNRYRTLADNLVKDIDSYNRTVEEVNSKLKTGESGGLKKMPYIVVVIDEFADLMAVASKDVELAVLRIAQKARAAGIHLIIATQRPTRDIVTGTIKSNLPTRISFRVASGLDSRTILDTGGAEQLLGMGDMLLIPPGESEPHRVHGAFVSSEEIKRVVAFIKERCPQDAYDDLIQITTRPSDFIETASAREDDEEQDALWNEVIEYLKKNRSCSASMLQRKFKIGYNRASRLVDQLEAAGIVGPGDGAKPRDVLLPED